MTGFAMLERDTVTGLNLAVYREENPGTGRWDSQDPLGFWGGDLNLYRYVGNQASASDDPFGLQQPRRRRIPPAPLASDLIRDPNVSGGMSWLLQQSDETPLPSPLGLGAVAGGLVLGKLPIPKTHEEGAWVFRNRRTGKIFVVYERPGVRFVHGKGRAHFMFGRKPYIPDCDLIAMIHTHPDPVLGGYSPDPLDSLDMDNQQSYGVPWIIATSEFGAWIVFNGSRKNFWWKPTKPVEPHKRG